MKKLLLMGFFCLAVNGIEKDKENSKTPKKEIYLLKYADYLSDTKRFYGIYDKKGMLITSLMLYLKRPLFIDCSKIKDLSNEEYLKLKKSLYPCFTPDSHSLAGWVKGYILACEKKSLLNRIEKCRMK